MISKEGMKLRLQKITFVLSFNINNYKGIV